VRKPSFRSAPLKAGRTPTTIMKERYFKKPLHTPAHLFVNDSFFFITAGCYHKKAYVDSDAKKEFLYVTICKEVKRYLAELHGWVLLDNHYHILIKLQDAFLLPRLIQTIHSKSAITINNIDGQRGRKVWYDYWDECIRDQKDFYTKLNYIHLNPVKHGYVDDPAKYPFSSYHPYFSEKGEDKIRILMSSYPVDKVKTADDF
jgi:putative transposase